MQRAFVIRGFGTKKDSGGNSVDFELVHATLIEPALKRCDMAGGTTAQEVDAGNIRADMFALILEADIVICDITVHNANVFYELGVRHALRKKHTILIKGDPSNDTTPFDLSTDRYLKYSLVNPADALGALVDAIQASLRSNRETDSPIFLMLPALSEADRSEVTLVPMDFIEEVKRAEVALDKGWLRVIAEDLRGQRFQWDGLRRVAQSQWSVRDMEGARANWEALRQAVGTNVEADLALASLYERAYRIGKQETLLESSNQAIRRVLDAAQTAPAQRAEALALEGRNLKTLWRSRFDGSSDSVATLQLAIDARALQSYQSYRDAFEIDLNAFYPGLAALQMGTILLRLAALPGWRNLFKGNRLLADRARQDLEVDLPALAHVVGASITRARKQLPDDERIWADIADADLLFLSVPDEELQVDHSMVVQAYQDAIPNNKRFAWDAASGQLALFATLGYRAVVAQAVMQAVMQAFGESVDQTAPPREHLLVFAGHCIDADGAPPRFPANAEAQARELLKQRLQNIQKNLQADEVLAVLASAAPGADILVHEVCAELGIRCRLCLPMSADTVAQDVFPNADHWRSRFWDVVNARRADLLQLADQSDLPRWLQGRPGLDPWERGNRWVMHLAESWSAQRVSLLVLWDGQDNGTNGGTAHMVRMARAIGRFNVETIDSRQLLN
jgi:hypothetical protein